MALALVLLSGCVGSSSRLELVTLEGVRVAGKPIQSDIETRNCVTRILSLIPLSVLGRATPEATLRRSLTQFPDGNGLSDVSVAGEYRNYAFLLDRHCWTVRGDVTAAE